MVGADRPDRERPVVVLLGAGDAPGRLTDLLAQRSTDEAGRTDGRVVDPTARGWTATATAPATESGPPAGLVLLDTQVLTVPTVYGDLVADPRPGPAVLTVDDRVAGVRVPAAAVDLVSALDVGDPGAVLTRLATLLRERGPVREVTPGAFPAVRVGDGGADLDAALATVDAADEEGLRLRRASRGDDGFLSTFLIRPMSRQVTRRLVPTGIRPATVTAVSLTLGLASALTYAVGGAWALLAGSLLLLLSLVIDCVDGEIARYTRTFSALGGWLDVASDRVKEYAVYAGLVVGAGREGTDLWPLALAAMALLVARHFVDFGFAATRSGTGDQSAVAAWSDSTSRRPALLWAKRAVIMPVGERTIVLVVLAPLAGPRAALGVLLAWGLVAAAYTTLGRLGRVWGGGRTAAMGALARAQLVAQCDSGPVRGWPVGGRLGWLWPAVLRVLESGLVVGACWLSSRSLLPAAFAVLAVVAFRLYDVVYRQRLTGSAPPPDRLTPWGWPVRAALVLLAVGVASWSGANPTATRWALVGAAAVWLVAAVGSSVAFWRSQPAGATAP